MPVCRAEDILVHRAAGEPPTRKLGDENTITCAALVIGVKWQAMTAPNTRYDISIQAESAYIHEQSQPESERYVFAYTVTIRNIGQIAAQLLTRHWIITDANGKVQEVRGDGVVGEQPHLNPGEGFQYTSASIIETPVGSMHGSYQMVADDGVKFDAEISPFRLSTTDQLH